MVMRILKSVLLTLSTGYILMYFSEHLFWSRIRPGDSITGWFATWIAYSLMAFIFLVLVSYFRVKTLWSLFLAGAIFGWIGEGIVVQTAYEMLPLSISFTGLAWHALIAVWVGWYAFQKSLLSSNPRSILKLSIGVGFCYGLWAINWWLEPDGGVSSVSEFAAFSFITTLLVILAYRLANWSSSASLILNRWIIIFISSIFLLYFCFVTIPAVSVAAIILPLLFGITFLALFQNRINESEGSFLDMYGERIPFLRYLSLFVLPATGVLFYALAVTLNLRWHTGWILYLITTPLGFLLFGVSLYKIRQRKSVSPLRQSG